MHMSGLPDIRDNRGHEVTPSIICADIYTHSMASTGG